jgi:ketosteroid isomerase-like protein
MRLCIVGVLVVLLSAACAAPPATLSQSDIDAIKATSRAYAETALAQDWAKWVTTFQADAKFLVPNTPILEGAPAIEKWGRAFPSLKTIALEPLEIEGQGNTAWTRGRYSYVAEVPGLGEVSDTGKYVEIWRKQTDGSWKLYRDIFNSDMPPPTPPPPAPAPPPAGKR